MIIEGLAHSGCAGAKEMAEELAGGVRQEQQLRAKCFSFLTHCEVGSGHQSRGGKALNKS
eukprot:scaffold157965_cov23-Tisochrysis_lutea.AAC.1